MLYIRQWKNDLEAISNEVRDTFGQLDMETLQTKPSSDGWSIADNLEHLIKVNRSYFPIFKKLQNGSYRGAFIGKISIFPNLLGRLIYNSVSDGRTKKTKTFKAWEPTQEAIHEDIINQFLVVQDQIIQWLNEPFIEKNPVIHSPINPLIVYNLHQAIRIIIEHEKRHLDQAKDVLRHTNSP
jgi:hypothetical protein